MTYQPQIEAYIPLVLSEVLITEDVQATIICEADASRAEGFAVIEIRIHAVAGKAQAVLSDKSEGVNAHLWAALKDEAVKAAEYAGVGEMILEAA